MEEELVVHHQREVVSLEVLVEVVVIVHLVTEQEDQVIHLPLVHHKVITVVLKKVMCQALVVGV